MSVVLSEPVGDVVAAVGKLRADDGLVTDTGQQLAEIEALLDTITVLQSAVSDRLAEAAKVGATAEHYGRSPKRWLVEDVLIAGPEAARYVNLANWLAEFPATRAAFAAAPRTVIITMDLEMLEARLRDGWLTLPSGAQISAETARRLACDAQLVPVVLGRNGEMLDIGQADHEFTASQRRAAWVRDQGRCAFPDCHNPPGQLHHIIWRSRQGPTSVDNAAWLCHYHHRLTHEGGWTLQRTPDGHYLWTGPHGQHRTRTLQTARKPQTA